MRAIIALWQREPVDVVVVWQRELGETLQYDVILLHDDILLLDDILHLDEVLHLDGIEDVVAWRGLRCLRTPTRLGHLTCPGWHRLRCTRPTPTEVAQSHLISTMSSP